MIKDEILEFLDMSEVDYTVVNHSPAFSIEECKKIEKLIDGRICKNLFLRTVNGEKRFLLMIDEDKKFVTGKVSKLLGSSRLCFASGEEMEEILSTKPGSLSFLSLYFDKEKAIRFAVDSDILREEYICCHPCDNTSTLKIRTSDVLNVILPKLGAEPIIIEI